MAELESPEVMSKVINFLSCLFHRAAKSNDTTFRFDTQGISVFHGLTRPTISIQSYLERIFKYVNCSPSCFIVAYIYLDRFTSLPINSFNVHRLLITSVLVSAKFMDDMYDNNAYYAKVGGISTTEMNLLEVAFLFGLGFQLNVTPNTFYTYCSYLQREMLPLQSPLHLEEPTLNLERPSEVSMQMPNEASLSQLLDDPSTLPPSQKFYSHARRPRPVTSDSTPMPKKGRGTLKGLKVAKKASETSDGKLPITFSRKFGGPIDINYRTFVDSVVVQVRQHLPLNVKNWKEIPDENKNILKAKVLNKWRLDDDDNTQAKIFKIAKERYRGWRADLSATYKTYKHDREAIIRNKPQELNMDAWNDVISYFESDDFKTISDRNAKNRSKRGSIHYTGSKSFAQISFENRDPETQKEPDDLQMWALAYCPKGQWAHDTPKHVYEEAKEKIAEMEVNEDRTLSSSERDTIFQSVVSMSGSKSSSKSRYVLGRGYMAKLPTSTERVRNELNSEVQSMKSQLDAERAERVAERAEMEAKFEAERAKRAAEHAEMEVQFQRLRQTMREKFLGGGQ